MLIRDEWADDEWGDLERRVSERAEAFLQLANSGRVGIDVLRDLLKARTLKLRVIEPKAKYL